MKYKGLLLDIDNTLYDYDTAHAAAHKAVADFCHTRHGTAKEVFDAAFLKARKAVHVRLDGTASSHNRLLYFQLLLESLEINPLLSAFEMYGIYWDVFLDHIVVFDGVYELFEKYKGRICLLTDLTADVQYKKVIHLGLEKYTQHIVTSEEAGIDKPAQAMFRAALLKLGLSEDEVCMIGDSYSKDVMGAYGMGIRSIWLNVPGKKESYDSVSVSEVASFKQILALV